MTATERRSAALLASIFSLRLLGLFLILPVFSIYAKTLPSGNDLTLVGIAFGAYGATQMLLQIAYGSASDYFGRKPVIIFGLLLFAAGSLVAALSTDIYGIIIGRALQGAGAISAAVTALVADLTRPQHLTKAMAMIGVSIGLSFAFSMVVAPLLYVQIGMPGLFILTGVLSLLAILVLVKIIPDAPASSTAKPRQAAWPSFIEVLKNRQLMRMNFGVFALHLTQTAMWVLLPSVLVDVGGLDVSAHWKIYLPTLFLSFAVMIPALIAAEKHGKMKLVFNTAIGLLLVVQLGFGFLSPNLTSLVFWMLLFFIAFNILEATQPSLISRLAPPHAKGAALGIYNTTQSCGLFLGGLFGGFLAKHFGASLVWLFCALLILIWLLLGLSLRLPALKKSPQKT